MGLQTRDCRRARDDRAKRRQARRGRRRVLELATARLRARRLAAGANDRARKHPFLLRCRPHLTSLQRLGGCEQIDAERALAAAASLAASSDIAVVFAGLTPEWESEGFDRPTLALPGLQDALIARVAAANPRTVVVLQAGSAVGMPWAGAVAGVVQAWYSGNEVGNAIADVLYGRVNPAGRLPLTIPVSRGVLGLWGEGAGLMRECYCRNASRTCRRGRT